MKKAATSVSGDQCSRAAHEDARHSLVSLRLEFGELESGHESPRSLGRDNDVPVRHLRTRPSCDIDGQMLMVVRPVSPPTPPFRNMRMISAASATAASVINSMTVAKAFTFGVAAARAVE